MPSQAVDHLELYPIPSVVAPTGYHFGVGGGEYAVTGGYIALSLAFTGQNPSTRYSLVLSVNGSSRTIGNYTSDSEGAATTSASAYLGTGFFALTLYVFDLTGFNVPTAVLITIPTEFFVNAHVVSTTSSTASSSTTSSSRSSSTSSSSSTETVPPTAATSTASGPSWGFKLQDVYIPNLPRAYRFATSGTVTVTLNPTYALLGVVVGFTGANPAATYNAALVLNGSNTNLGTMTTNANGGTELHSSIQVSPGRYFMGIAIYDVSDIGAFNASGPVLVMLSDPETQFIDIPGNATTSSSTSQSSSVSVVTTTVTTSVTTISAGSKVEQQIQTALQNLTIPAVVQITPSTSSDTVYDSRFSLSIGQLQAKGVVIAISGANVTGSRVLLINMSRDAPLALFPALNITLDGFPVAEASSALQVLDATPSNPPYYVLVGTSTSIQILVSIPHFSVHLLQIAGEVVHVVQNAFLVDSPLLVGSMAVVTIAFAVAYLTRKRYVPSPL